MGGTCHTFASWKLPAADNSTQKTNLTDELNVYKKRWTRRPNKNSGQCWSVEQER
jgi:hypothetical protein